jgi:hypothetical protein
MDYGLSGAQLCSTFLQPGGVSNLFACLQKALENHTQIFTLVIGEYHEKLSCIYYNLDGTGLTDYCEGQTFLSICWVWHGKYLLG